MDPEVGGCGLGVGDDVSTDGIGLVGRSGSCSVEDRADEVGSNLGVASAVVGVAGSGGADGP